MVVGIWGRTGGGLTERLTQHGLKQPIRLPRGLPHPPPQTLDVSTGSTTARATTPAKAESRYSRVVNGLFSIAEIT